MNRLTVPYPESQNISFLSPSVQWLLTQVTQPYEDEEKDKSDDGDPCEPQDGCTRIQRLITEVQNQLRICRQKACGRHTSGTAELKHIILPVATALRRVSRAFQHLTKNDVEGEDAASRYLLWTRNVELFDTIFNLLQEANSGDVTSTSTAMLIGTSALERALGHVHLMFDPQVPSLTKDLLASQALQKVLGQDHMWMLQVLIGSPTLLNIRNILWHGFAAPNDISLQVGQLIFAIVLSIGQILESCGLTIDVLPFRPTVDFKCVVALEGILPDLLDSGHIDVLQSLFYVSPFIPNIMLPYWNQALKKVTEERYSEALALVLPQFEHSMRCLFAHLNNCPERTMTAESTVLYTTFDEILAQHLPNGQLNQLYGMVDKDYMVALHDILLYPDGPRIRDHFSHGEFDYMKLPRAAVIHILGLSAAFCHLVLPSTESLLLSQKEPLKSILKVLCHYEPRFHPCTIIKRQIHDLLVDCHQWPNPNVEVVFNESRDSEFQSAAMKLTSNLDKEWQNCLSLFQTNGLGVVQTLKVQLQYLKIETLHRSRQEWEFLCQMKRLMTYCLKSSQQISNTVECRSQMLQRRELRSRQRSTYIKMTTSLPTLRRSLMLTSVIVCVVLVLVNDLSSDPCENLKYKKLLNSAEWFSENLKSLTDPTKNRWEESQSLTFDYLNRILKVLKTSLRLDVQSDAVKNFG